MKKILSIAALLLLGLSAGATVVSFSDAEALAKKHFGGVKSVSHVWSGFETKSSSPAFYVFDNPAGGWVIISGEDSVNPLLGYSDKGSFRTEGMPSNVRYWFDRMSNTVAYARKAGLEATPATRAKWQNVGIRTKAGAAKLIETAEWDQGAPYNDSCKVACRNKSVYTGCVATAMAIVIRHNEWPAKGKGKTDAYTTDSDEYSIPSRNVGSHTYNYANMPLTDGGTSTWTKAQKAAVAQLMYDLGAMVYMDYTTDGSGAYSSDIAPALVSHMYYGGTAREVMRAGYSNNEWFSILKAEIDADAPLIYGAADGDGYDASGHQFVIDGYDADCNVHVNWGWAGECNGYFPVCYLDSGDGYVFSYYDSAIVGLRKDEASANTDLSGEIYLASYPELKSGSVAKGSTFVLGDIEFLNASSNTAYNGKVKAALCTMDGTLKEYIGAETSLKVVMDNYNYEEYPSSSISDYTCTISSDVAFGDKICFYYQLSDGTWAYAGGAMSAYESYINLSQTYTAGQSLYFELVPALGGVESITWYFDGSKTSKEYVALKSGTHTVKAVVKNAAGNTETISQKIKVQ